MEENKGKCHKCYNCGNYTPYYVKGSVRFERTDKGHCRAHRRQVNKRETCERWASSSFRYTSIIKEETKKELHRIISSLSQIRQIMEEQGENGEN